MRTGGLRITQSRCVPELLCVHPRVDSDVTCSTQFKTVKSVTFCAFVGVFASKSSSQCSCVCGVTHEGRLGAAVTRHVPLFTAGAQSWAPQHLVCLDR
jgi:hypothetical protein